jgi:general stress protein 26
MTLRLSRSEIDFVKKLPVCRLATMTKDCEPMVRRVWPVFDGKFVYIATDAGLPKVKQIEDNPKVSIIFDDYDRNNWVNLQGVRMQGDAKILWEGEEYRSAHKRLMDKYPEYRPPSELS